MTDHEAQYRESRDVLGPPSPEFTAFFERYEGNRATVLDLGCGQGRDAHFIARLGHHVLGVDISPTGVSQMLQQAEQEGLDMQGVVADLIEYEPSGEFDVVLLDRVLHMLDCDRDRTRVLDRASAVIRPAGFILVADTPKHQDLIRSFFASRPQDWTTIHDKNGFLFAQSCGQRNTVTRPNHSSDSDSSECQSREMVSEGIAGE
jgi:SAM-dependent methyltransferase